MKAITWMKSVAACPESQDWVGDRTLKQAWNECPRADWLLWAAARAGVDRHQVGMAACDCALSVRHLTDARVGESLEVMTAWCEDLATDKDLKVAYATLSSVLYTTARADNAAVYAASAAHAAASFVRAIRVAQAAYTADATDAAYNTANAYVAAAAAASSSGPASRDQALAELCALVRGRISAEDFVRAVESRL